MNKFFDTDNFLWRWFGKIGSFLCLSLVWLLCCIPIVTIATSCIALYDSVAHCIQGPEEHPCKRFFRTFKAEFFRGLGLSVLWGVISALLAWGYYILYQMGKENEMIALYSLIYLGTMLIPLCIYAWLIPIESRFQYSFGQLHKTALIFTIAHLPTTGIILLLLIAAILLLITIPASILLMPCILVTLQCWFIEKVFKNYMPEEEEANDALV